MTGAVIAAALALPGVAFAGGDGSRSGALGRVTSSVGQQTGSSGGRSGSGGSSHSPSGSSTHDGSGDHDGYRVRGYYPQPYACVGCGPVIVTGSAAGGPVTPGPSLTEMSLELGLASVQDSDGAARGSFRMLSGRMGLGVEASHYFERDRGGSGEWIRMNLWSVLGVGSLVDTGATRLSISGGLAGTSATAFDRILGPTVGVELEHALGSGLGTRIAPRGSARLFAFEEGVTAYELYAGARVSSFAVGWRYLRFNADSTPLQGPEIGLALRF